MNNRQTEISERLKNYTDRHYRYQIELARKINMSPAMFYDIINGRKPINAKWLAKLKELENLDINWLLTGEQSRSNNMVSKNGEQYTIPGIAEELKELRKDNDELRKEVKEVKQYLDQAISYNSVIQYRLSDLQKENQKLKEDKEKLSVEVSSLNKALQGVNKKK